MSFEFEKTEFQKFFLIEYQTKCKLPAAVLKLPLSPERIERSYLKSNDYAKGLFSKVKRLSLQHSH